MFCESVQRSISWCSRKKSSSPDGPTQTVKTTIKATSVGVMRCCPLFPLPVPLFPVAMVPVAMVPVAMEPFATVPVAMVPVAASSSARPSGRFQSSLTRSDCRTNTLQHVHTLALSAIGPHRLDQSSRCHGTRCHGARGLAAAAGAALTLQATRLPQCPDETDVTYCENDDALVL